MLSRSSVEPIVRQTSAISADANINFTVVLAVDTSEVRNPKVPLLNFGTCHTIAEVVTSTLHYPLCNLKFIFFFCKGPDGGIQFAGIAESSRLGDQAVPARLVMLSEYLSENPTNVIGSRLMRILMKGWKRGMGVDTGRHVLQAHQRHSQSVGWRTKAPPEYYCHRRRSSSHIKPAA